MGDALTQDAARLMKSKLTGQLFVRDGGGDARDGRRLVMVVGVLAIPEHAGIKYEHQYTLFGNKVLGGFRLSMLCGDQSIDRTVEARGENLGNLVMQAIWRV